MSNLVGSYSLQGVLTPQQWSAYHAIRRDSIFAPLLPGQTYDERDPDEFKHGNLPHVLVRDGDIVGAVRIDLIDATQAGVRLIGIRSDHPTSLTFYLANGYREGEWRDAGPVPATLIRVGKRLG